MREAHIKFGRGGFQMTGDLAFRYDSVAPNMDMSQQSELARTTYGHGSMAPW